MEALLRQSKGLCPFLKKTSPATLRSLSTSTAQSASTGGSSMSNLQLVARRCPVMGKALAVQSARAGNAAINGSYGNAFVRAYHAKVNKANLHTSTAKEAQAIDVGVGRQVESMDDSMALATLHYDMTSTDKILSAISWQLQARH